MPADPTQSADLLAAVSRILDLRRWADDQLAAALAAAALTSPSVAQMQGARLADRHAQARALEAVFDDLSYEGAARSSAAVAGIYALAFETALTALDDLALSPASDAATLETKRQWLIELGHRNHPLDALEHAAAGLADGSPR